MSKCYTDTILAGQERVSDSGLIFAGVRDAKVKLIVK